MDRWFHLHAHLFLQCSLYTITRISVCSPSAVIAEDAYASSMFGGIGKRRKRKVAASRKRVRKRSSSIQVITAYSSSELSLHINTQGLEFQGIYGATRVLSSARSSFCCGRRLAASKVLVRLDLSSSSFPNIRKYPRSPVFQPFDTGQSRLLKFYSSCTVTIIWVYWALSTHKRFVVDHETSPQISASQKRCKNTFKILEYAAVKSPTWSCFLEKSLFPKWGANVVLVVWSYTWLERFPKHAWTQG